MGRLKNIKEEGVSGNAKMKKDEPGTFYPVSRKAWRKWLEKNHLLEQSVWMICYTKRSEVPTISWSEAVDEALCFGWIDSTRRSLGDNRFTQLFSRRKPGSTWSKINKEKVKQLIDSGLMTPAGYESIEKAKQNGSWKILDDVEELKIPDDLEQAFKVRRGSKEYFMSLSRSARKAILQWLVLARRPETRQKRIEEIAELAAQKMKPKQFR